MRSLMIKSVGTTVLAMGLLLSPLLYAQTAKPGTAERADQASPLMQRNQAMGALMQDMTREMATMQEQMGKGDISPEMRKEMSQKMKRMSGLMSRMSGLIDRPTMKDAEANRQLEQMRKQMGEMSKGSSMKEQKK